MKINTHLRVNNKNISGFSLVELLVVVAIIGVLASVAIVSFSGYSYKAKISATEANFKTIDRKLANSAIACMTGIEVVFGPFANRSPNTWTCSGTGINADRVAYSLFLELKDNFQNPHNDSVSAIEWSNGSCPGPNPAEGQITIGYAHKNNTCGMAGNMACVSANIGDSDGDGINEILTSEYNFCNY